MVSCRSALQPCQRWPREDPSLGDSHHAPRNGPADRRRGSFIGGGESESRRSLLRNAAFAASNLAASPYLQVDQTPVGLEPIGGGKYRSAMLAKATTKNPAMMSACIHSRDQGPQYWEG